MTAIPVARGIPEPGYAVDLGDTTAHLRAVALMHPDGAPVLSGRTKSGSVRFRSDLLAAPDGGPDGDENPGVVLGDGAAAVRVGVVLAPVHGAKCGLFVITAYDAATTYTAKVAGATYSTSTATTAQEAAEEIATAINAAAADREDPRAEAVQVSYDGADCWAVLITVWGADLETAPSAVFLGTSITSGGTGTAVQLVTPTTITYRVCVRPASSPWATGKLAYAVHGPASSITTTANYAATYDLSDCDRVAVEVTAATVDESDTDCLALIGVDVAEAVEA